MQGTFCRPWGSICRRQRGARPRSLAAKGAHADNTLKEANAHPGIYSGAVILATWDELEHVDGKLDVSRIEAGLDAVRAYNAKYPATPLAA